MNSKYSILNPTEQQYVQSRLIQRRKQQLEHLSEDLALHEFLLLESDSSHLIAFESGSNSVSWSADQGFSVNLSEAFYLDIAQVAVCFRAVRKVFFEDFCERNPAKTATWVHAEVPVGRIEPKPPIAETGTHPDSEFLEEGLQTTDVFSGGQEIAPEDEISMEAEPEPVVETEPEPDPEPDPEPELESEPEPMVEDDDDDDDLLSRMEDLGSRQIEVGDHSAADEFSNLATDEETPSAMFEQEAEPQAEIEDSEPVDEVELLKAEMLAAGMDDGKANKLIAAVRSGKATVDAVRQTLKKLAGG